jgi:hypothetical protein
MAGILPLKSTTSNSPQDIALRERPSRLLRHPVLFIQGLDKAIRAVLDYYRVDILGLDLGKSACP